MGVQDEDLFTSLANRLIRLDKQLTDNEQAKLLELSSGKNLKNLVKDLLNAYDPDVIEQHALPLLAAKPDFDRSPEFEEQCHQQAQAQLATQAAKTSKCRAA